MRMVCPDPLCGVVMRVDRVSRRQVHHADVSAAPLPPQEPPDTLHELLELWRHSLDAGTRGRGEPPSGSLTRRTPFDSASCSGPHGGGRAGGLSERRARPAGRDTAPRPSRRLPAAAPTHRRGGQRPAAATAPRARPADRHADHRPGRRRREHGPVRHHQRRLQGHALDRLRPAGLSATSICDQARPGHRAGRPLDDITWELKLRQGVTFHNGEPFDADAVKFSFARYVDPSDQERLRHAAEAGHRGAGRRSDAPSASRPASRSPS